MLPTAHLPIIKPLKIKLDVENLESIFETELILIRAYVGVGDKFMTDFISIDPKVIYGFKS